MAGVKIKLMSDRKLKLAFYFHRWKALKTGVGFFLTFEQWLKIWVGSGHLAERGRRRGQYNKGKVMSLESRRRMSASAKGRVRPRQVRCPRRQDRRHSGRLCTARFRKGEDDMSALCPSATNGEFSVYWWDPDDRYYAEKQYCGDREAVETALSLTRRPAAKIGIIKRVMITDGGDCCVYEWKDGEQVFPEKETMT